MGDRLIRKGLVVGTIFLFIGTNFISGTNIQLKNTNLPLITTRGYIQDLIDNASDDDTIYIPSGTYYENIIINKNINLVGENKDTTIIDGSYSGTVVSIVSDCVNISGFTIQKSGDEWENEGIQIFSNHTIITSNNIFKNRRGNGIYLYNSSSNTITDNNFSDNNNGIFFHESNSNIIIGNNISNNKCGIYLSYKSFNHNNVITGNNIISNNEYGILHEYSNSNNIITGNSIISNNGGGIGLRGSSGDIITGNIISNNGDGIQLWGSRDNTIIGNTIRLNNHYGILLSSPSSGNNITGNNISNNEDGISLHGGNGNIITGNNIISNNEDGIQLWYSSGNNITGNIISYNDDGIYLEISGNNIITSNNITYNKGDGIYFYMSSGNNITGNSIISNNNDGIFLDYSSDNTIKVNTISNNQIGIYLDNSNSNTIQRNNFLYNLLNAFFFTYTLGKNDWQQNYWNRPRILPKLIFGTIEINSKKIPCINIDWHPAKKPTCIIVSMVQTGGYISIQKVTGGEIADITGVSISFVASNGTIAGYGTYNDIDSDGAVSGGDTISPPAGLTTGVLYTVTMTYYDYVIGTCKFTLP